MSTNGRPFFANFLSAFRTQSTIQKVAGTQSSAVTGTSLQTSYGHSSTASSSSSQSNPASGSRSMSTKSTTQQTPSGATTAALQAARQLQSTRQHSTSAYSRSPGSPPAPAGFSPVGGPASRQRRGSDSSNEGGFRDARHAEKLYIGGRTAAGEEKFYKLSMVKRPASIDRLSVDRMSL